MGHISGEGGCWLLVMKGSCGGEDCLVSLGGKLALGSFGMSREDVGCSDGMEMMVGDRRLML